MCSKFTFTSTCLYICTSLRLCVCMTVSTSNSRNFNWPSSNSDLQFKTPVGGFIHLTHTILYSLATTHLQSFPMFNTLRVSCFIIARSLRACLYSLRPTKRDDFYFSSCLVMNYSTSNFVYYEFFNQCSLNTLIFCVFESYSFFSFLYFPFLFFLMFSFLFFRFHLKPVINFTCLIFHRCSSFL